MDKRDLTFQDVIDNITECLSEAEGEYIAQVHNRIATNAIEYIGDSLWRER